MKPTTAQRRLRKYARKKRNSRNPRLEAYLTLYWRYWHKVYGPHICLWRHLN